MPIVPSNFQISVNPTPITCVIGKETTLNIYSSNTSLTDNCYNLSYVITLPDGVSYVSASIPETDISYGAGGTIIVTFTNIKNLAYNELNYLFTITLESDTTFRQTGLPVPLDVPINSVVVDGHVDTMPRGNDDIGNVVITKTVSSSFTPIRYKINKSAPSKKVKGAGEILPPEAPLWIFQYRLTLSNAKGYTSDVTLIDNLPNGVRYLDSLSVTGPDSAVLSSPTVYPPTIGTDYYILDWGNVTLSDDSTNVITFDVAIWDNYTDNGIENSGGKIPHGTTLTNEAIMNGLSGTATANANTAAMDATIYKNVDSENTDIGDTLNYTLDFYINQYDNVDTFVITDTLPNGQSYDNGSASISPTSVTPNIDGTTTIIWEIGNLVAGSTGTITFSATVLPTYIDGAPIVSDDSLYNIVEVNGVNATTVTETPDSDNAGASIFTPYVTKNLLGYYYKDGTLKTYGVASPGDLVEFELSYYSTGINAEAAVVQVDDFAPLNMGPLSGLSIAYGGSVPGPFFPFQISPNGIRWTLGTVPGDSTWTAIFKIPVLNTVYIGGRNNLVTINAENTSGRTYSDRDQVEVLFGEPNVSLAKTLTPSGLLSVGPTYVYTVTVSNLEDGSGLVTDAFNMTLTDILPTGMTYSGVYNVSGSGSYDPPVFSGQNITMLITKLAPNESLVFSYNVTLDNGVAAGAFLTNRAQLTRPYSQPDSSFQYPGSPLTASVSRQIVSSTITKTSSSSEVALGEDFNYTITVAIPQGTRLYAPQITDILPTNEVYVGSATTQVPPAAPVSVTPNIVGQNVIFPPYPNITAGIGGSNLIYTFVARASNAIHVPPYEENQTNTVSEKWYTNPELTQFLSLSASSNITVTTPNIELFKEQRNFTQDTPFTTDQIVLDEGDVLYYRLSVTSNGSSTAYNIDLNDFLPASTSYVAIVDPPTSGTISVTGVPGGQTVHWIISSLATGVTATVVFRVNLLLQSASASLINTFGGSYRSYNSGAPAFYTAQSNEVVALAPNLGFYVSVSNKTPNVGSIVRYYLHLYIPAGIVAYNINISDTLPDGQKYLGNAKRNQFSITPTVVGQTISFPTEDVIGPFPTSTTVIYSFDAEVIAGPQKNQINTQIDLALLNWDLSPLGPASKPVETQVNLTITNAPPSRGIFIEDIKKGEFFGL